MPSRRSSSHIEINGVPYVLAARPRVMTNFQAGEDGQRTSGLNVPFSQSLFSRGFGYKDEGVPGSYSEGDGVCTCFGFAMPAGEVVQLPLPDLHDNELVSADLLEDDGLNLYLGGGRAITKLLASDPYHPVLEVDLGADYVVGSVINFKGSIYVGGSKNGVVDALYRRTTGSGVWQGFASVLRNYAAINYWVSAGQNGVGDQHLVMTDTPFSFRHCTGDPTDPGAWSAQYDVSNPHPIKSIASSAHLSYFCCTDSVRSVDERGYAAPITPGWSKNMDDGNGVASLIYDGNLLVGHVSGLLEVDVSSQRREDLIKPIDPMSELPQEGRISGRVTALAAAGGRLVGASYSFLGDTDGTGYLWHAKKDADGVWRFCGPVWHAPGEKITFLRQWNPGGVPMLLIGTIASFTPRLYLMSMPDVANPYQDWKQHGNMRFQTRWSLTLSRPTFGDEVALKAIQDVETVSENLSTDTPERRIEVYDQVDENDEVKLLTTNSDTYAVASASGAVGTRHKFRIVGTGSPTEPAILHSIKVTADLSRRIPKYFRYVIGLDRNNTLRTGTRSRKDPKTSIRALEDLQWSPPVDGIDHFGQQVEFDVQRVQEVSSPEATGNGWKNVIEVVVRVVKEIRVWNDGSVWDTPGDRWPA